MHPELQHEQSHTKLVTVMKYGGCNRISSCRSLVAGATASSVVTTMSFWQSGSPSKRVRLGCGKHTDSDVMSDVDVDFDAVTNDQHAAIHSACGAQPAYLQHQILYTTAVSLQPSQTRQTVGAHLAVLALQAC